MNSTYLQSTPETPVTTKNPSRKGEGNEKEHAKEKKKKKEQLLDAFRLMKLDETSVRRTTTKTFQIWKGTLSREKRSNEERVARQLYRILSRGNRTNDNSDDDNLKKKNNNNKKKNDGYG